MSKAIAFYTVCLSTIFRLLSGGWLHNRERLNSIRTILSWDLETLVIFKERRLKSRKHQNLKPFNLKNRNNNELNHFIEKLYTCTFVLNWNASRSNNNTKMTQKLWRLNTNPWTEVDWTVQLQSFTRKLRTNSQTPGEYKFSKRRSIPIKNS